MESSTPHPAWMIPHLTLPNHGTRRLLLLRHAERPDIARGTTGDDLDITPAGTRLAADLGRRLDGPIVSALQSPVKRCQQTAAAFLADTPADAPTPIDAPWLSIPGLMVDDWDAAWNGFREMAFEDFMARYLADEPMPGFSPLDVVMDRFMAHLRDDVPATPGWHLLFTHDVMIALLWRTLSGKVPADSDFPVFLEGAFLTTNGTAETTVHYRENEWMF